LPALALKVFAKSVSVALMILLIMKIVQIFTKNRGFLRTDQTRYILMAISTITAGVPQSFFSLVHLPRGYVILIYFAVKFALLTAEFFLITLYYCRSRHVQAYMGGTDYQDMALFRFRGKGQQD